MLNLLCLKHYKYKSISFVNVYNRFNLIYFRMILNNDIKNVDKNTFDEINIDNEFFILSVKNNSEEVKLYERHIDNSFIQFHFCFKGESKLQFNKGTYGMPLNEEHSMLLYNPTRDLPLNVELFPRTWFLTLLISIKKFHSLFSDEADYITFLKEENKEKKYYTEKDITPSMSIILSQLINYNLHDSVRSLYFKGKAYELLSLYFNRAESGLDQQCPFLVDEANVLKIKKAKEIILDNMAEPPNLAELSEQIDLNSKKLKEGFKQIYGDTVYGFLLDHKLEYARKLLESGKMNVNEVGLKIGYSTSSHFIAAFKKKYGTTPKKYLMSLS
jgi:AraC-like DNA-binding protein